MEFDVNDFREMMISAFQLRRTTQSRGQVLQNNIPRLYR